MYINYYGNYKECVHIYAHIWQLCKNQITITVKKQTSFVIYIYIIMERFFRSHHEMTCI